MANDRKQPKGGNSIIAQVADRIKDSSNVLIALSKNPSIDELTAALGLTMMIDKLGKRSTAIFSGHVPNIIEFLEPEKTFETNTNSLQDFIIALDKEKADHLRYKVEGDYVKVFITPYKTTIDESDMEFSHGDYNVDLVIALNVASTSDLDAALTEYGRIMHDASSINISAAAPGKFGDIEWGNPGASSISEMICQLGNELKTENVVLFDKTISTALLAGIFASTNRFSNERTSSDTMQVAAKLMMSGADQQLISSNVPVDILTKVEEPKPVEKPVEKEEYIEKREESEEVKESEPEPEPEPVDPTNLTIKHGAVDFSHMEKKKEKTSEQIEAEKIHKEKQAAARAEAEKIAADRAKEAEEKAAAEREAKAKAAAEKARREKEQKEREEAIRKEIEERVAKRTSTSGIIANDDKKEDEDGVLNEIETTAAAVDEGISEAPKKNLDPIGAVVKPPELPKDYSAMMDAELKSDNASTEPTTSMVLGGDEGISQTPVEIEQPVEQLPLSAPNSAMPENQTVVEQSTVQEPATTTSEAVPPVEAAPVDFTPVAEAPVAQEPQPVQQSTETVAEQPVQTPVMGLPMPDGNILPPPPPLPFDMVDGALPDNEPSAQQFVEELQQSNPVMQDTVAAVEQAVEQVVEPVLPQPVDASAIVAPVEAAQPVVESTPAPEPTPAPAASEPADPGMYKIPGM